MELRRILMGLYLLAFPAMMWGQTPVVPGTADEEHSGHRKETPVNFGFKRRFHLFLVPCIPVQRQRSAHRRSAEQLQDRIFRLPFHADKLRSPLPATGNILQHQPVQHHLRETSARRRRIRSPAGGSSITSSIHSIDIPVIYGYNFIKEGPYSLAVFGGPKVRYIWDRKSDIDFENFDQVNIRERLRPLNLSFTVGVSVTISRVFFDFRYDMGLHNISKSVTYDIPADNNAADENTKNEIRFHRRDNVLSFSFGVFF